MSDEAEPSELLLKEYLSSKTNRKKDKRTFTEDVSRLLHSHADPNTRNADGDTGLILACKLENYELWELFIRFRADPLLDGSNKCTTLFFAAAIHSIEMDWFSEILGYFTADVDVRTEHGLTPLHGIFNSRPPNPLKCKALLEHGADPNASQCCQFRPLHLASMHNREAQLVIMLLEYGAEPNVYNYESKSPLFFAIQDRSVAACQILLEYGAIVDAKLFEMALASQNPHIARILEDWESERDMEVAFNMLSHKRLSSARYLPPELTRMISEPRRPYRRLANTL